MCMRRLTPFRDLTAGLFTYLVVHSRSHVLKFDPSTETIEVGDRVSARSAFLTLEKHGPHIYIGDVESRGGSMCPEFQARVAKYCRQDQPLRVARVRALVDQARAELARNAREATTSTDNRPRGRAMRSSVASYRARLSRRAEEMPRNPQLQNSLYRVGMRLHR